MKGAKILIVEDDAIIAEDLRDIVESAGHTVTGVAPTVERAIALLKFRLPDLVLLDVTLKQDGTGMDVAREINKTFKLPFIYITSYSDPSTVDEVVSTSPSGYVVKPFQSKDILPVISLALSNFHKANDIVPPIEILNSTLDKPISAQEYLVLTEICTGKANRDIADALSISINTVKTHIKRIYMKLNVDNKIAAMQAVMNR